MADSVNPGGSLTPIRSTSVRPRQPTVALLAQVSLALARRAVPGAMSREPEATVIQEHPKGPHPNACRCMSTFALLGQVPALLSHQP